MNRSPEGLRRERLASLVLRVSLEQAGVFCRRVEIPMRFAIGMLMNENVIFMNNAG